jgi:hypothetical protein
MRSPEKMMYERFCGTWANSNHDGKGPMAKLIDNPDGTFTYYTSLSGTGSSNRGAYTVEKRWTDSDGNSWYHLKATYPADPSSTDHDLIKIDNYNWCMEIQFSGSSYPAAIDPNDKHSSYYIYYRY